ncbi:MAG: zinc ABC transporter substrate-binding protein [Magnetovibrio sp.]|nr:zinc ABC transporter substrate-binding protein [Magnetovibrio sp.]
MNDAGAVIVMHKRLIAPLFTWTSSVMVCAVLILGSIPYAAQGAPPDVITSIKPVQALVKMVTGNLATPGLVMPANTSPHLFTLKPSQAKLLENADVVFWIGPTLETTLQGPLKNLSDEAVVIELLKVAGLDLLELNDKHDEGNDDHDHGNVDPHIWLSPSNARILIDAIAATLSAVDPNNAPDYAHNAKKAKQRISISIRKTKAFTKEMRPTAYLVQHDGFGYLAREFEFNLVGYIQTMPGREPGARHISKLLDQIKTKQVECLFHESQFSPKLAKRLEDEVGISVREIDPMGIYLTMTETTYVRIIQGIIVSMESCLFPRQSGKLIKGQ